MASCQSSAGIGKVRRQDRRSNHYATPPTFAAFETRSKVGWTYHAWPVNRIIACALKICQWESICYLWNRIYSEFCKSIKCNCSCFYKRFTGVFKRKFEIIFCVFRHMISLSILECYGPTTESDRPTSVDYLCYFASESELLTWNNDVLRRDQHCTQEGKKFNLSVRSIVEL